VAAAASAAHRLLRVDRLPLLRPRLQIAGSQLAHVFRHCGRGCLQPGPNFLGIGCRCGTSFP
jgi:hypothetical protein